MQRSNTNNTNNTNTNSTSGLEYIESYEETSVLFIRLLIYNTNTLKLYNMFHPNIISNSSNPNLLLLSNITKDELLRLQYVINTPIYSNNNSNSVSGTMNNVRKSSIAYCTMYHIQQLIKFDDYLHKIQWYVYI